MIEYFGGYHSYSSMVKALPEAVRRENDKHDTAVTVEEAKENILDWVPPEAHYVEQKCRNLDLAKAWASKHRADDTFGCVEARVIECDDNDPWECEVLEVWHSTEPGEWYRADD